MNADGEFRRIVGLGRFLDSGANVTRLAGGQVDSRVSEFLEPFGSTLAVGGHRDRLEVGLMSRRRKYSVRGMPMKKKQMRIEMFGRRIPRDNGEFQVDAGRVVEET